VQVSFQQMMINHPVQKLATERDQIVHGKIR